MGRLYILVCKLDGGGIRKRGPFKTELERAETALRTLRRAGDDLASLVYLTIRGDKPCVEDTSEGWLEREVKRLRRAEKVKP